MPALLAALFILALGVLLIVWGQSNRRRIEEDALNAPEQSGSAIVVNKTVVYPASKMANYMTPVARITLQFRIHDHLVTVRSSDSAKCSRIREGDTVRVSYRVGKSGDYYIDDWQPATSLRPIP